MSTAAPAQAYVGMREEAKVYRAMGTETVLRARARDTGGAMEVIESSFPAGGGLPPHLHRTGEEAIYVLDGRMTIHVGDRPVEATPGTYVFVPRGVIHAFENGSGAPCRVLIWFNGQAGPGMETILEATASMPPGPPDMAKLVPMLKEFDIEIVPASGG